MPYQPTDGHLAKMAASKLRSLVQVVEDLAGRSPARGARSWNMLLNSKRIGTVKTLDALDGRRVSSSLIDPKYHGLGLGKKFYGELMRRAPSQTLYSDSGVSESARRVWQSFIGRPETYQAAAGSFTPYRLQAPGQAPSAFKATLIKPVQQLAEKTAIRMEVKTSKAKEGTMLNERDTYKVAFLTACADAGLDADETLAVAKEAHEKLAALNTLWEQPYNTAWDAVRSMGNVAKNVGMGAAVAAPLALGVGGGWAAAKATDLNDEDTDEIKLKELIDEHRRLAQRARMAAAMRASKSQNQRRGRPLI